MAAEPQHTSKTTSQLDYKKLGLMAGLEIHQQLNTKTKLFCGCPTTLRDTAESTYDFFRYLRTTESETGETDRASLEEVKLNKKFIYKAYDTTCLVENDEEPPRRLNEEALDVSLEVAKMLNLTCVDELYTMRKIVIDGSNTSGFQRTAFIGLGGYLESSQGRVGVDVLCLEEEAAQKVEGDKNSTTYSLDRLGIPLVEIGTAPDIVSPAHAKEVAAQIGMLLRSTGKVKRGLGTIRQDINVSIRDGARVEIKGVQALDLIETIVENEAFRQLNLVNIKDELISRSASVSDEIVDITALFKDTESTVVARALKSKGIVLALNLHGFAGIVGREVQTGRRFGTELSDRAKKAGVGGIFHTDELPNYGITKEEVAAVRAELGANENDCIILVADSKKRAHDAMEYVRIRAKEGMLAVPVPEETRKALPDGNSSYMRPLPSAARMYPETDVPPVRITQERLDSIKLSELIVDKIGRFMESFGLSHEFARLIAYSPNVERFEKAMAAGIQDINPTQVVRILETIMPELQKEGADTDNVSDDHLMSLFAMSAEGKATKEAIPEILKAIAKNPKQTVAQAIDSLGLGGVDEDAINAVVIKVVAQRLDFVKETGARAVGPLMGVVMKELSGKADGKLISKLLKEEIDKVT